MVRGLVVSNCTIQGHCWYRFEHANWPAQATRKLPSANDEARLHYYQRVKVEIEAVAVTRPDYEREIGEIPMPLRPLPAQEATV